MKRRNRIWREEKDGIYHRVKEAILEELSLCEEEHGIKLKALNIDSLIILYSKLPDQSIKTKQLRTNCKPT